MPDDIEACRKSLDALWAIAEAAGAVGAIEAVNHKSGDAKMLASAVPGSLFSFLFDAQCGATIL